VSQSSLELTVKNIIIKNTLFIDPITSIQALGHIVIHNGRFERFIALDQTQPENLKDFEVLDAQGTITTPHFIDIGASLPEPGFTHKGTIASEGKAAFFGGYATLASLPNTSPVIDSPAVFAMVQEKAKLAGQVKVLPLAAMTVGLEGKQLSEIFSLKRAGCIGFTQGRHRIEDARMLMRCLDYIATADMPVFFYPEHSQLAAGGCAHEGWIADQLGLPPIPACAETVALGRDLLLVERAGVKAHFCQISSQYSIELIQNAQAKGLPITADASISHLSYNESAIDNFDSIYHLRPPLRSESDRQALLAGIQNNVLQSISTGHRPQDLASKSAPFPETEPGMANYDIHVSEALALIDSQQLSPLKWVQALTSGPAKILGCELSGFQPGEIAALNIISRDEWTVNEANCKSHGSNIPHFYENMRGKVKWRIRGCQESY